MRWKDFLYFQRNSKIAVILLLILIVLTLILNVLLSYRNSSEVVLARNDSLVREFEEFRRNLIEVKPPAGVSEEREGSTDRFPERGGARHENISRNKEQNDSLRYNPESRGRTSSQAAYPSDEKLSAGETISLNEPDTAVWKKVPGIGSAFASRIVKYRNLMGGFVRVEQLLEVYGIDNELFSRISPYIVPDGNFHKLAVNKLEFKELLHHPYLNYKQVQVIIQLRRRKGNINSMRELSILDEFTPDDIFRLEPYLEF